MAKFDQEFPEDALSSKFRRFFETLAALAVTRDAREWSAPDCQRPIAHLKNLTQ